MAKIVNPVQFSVQFGLNNKKLATLGIFDPTLNVDSKLFIDPLLLDKSRHKEIRNARKSFKNFFSIIIKLLKASKKERDIAWSTAVKKLQIKEIKGTCLGYGAASISGRSIGRQMAIKITKTAKEIITLGVDDPDLFLVLPLLEENIGPDMISDMTTGIIIHDLLQFNVRMIKKIGIPVQSALIGDDTYSLPANPSEKKPTPVILVPCDILRKLPIANDWSEVCDVAAKNAALRNKVNRLIGEIWKAKTRRDKQKIRRSILASKEAFNTFMEVVHNTNPSPYDFSEDSEGVVVWRKMLTEIAQKYPLTLSMVKPTTPQNAFDIVRKIIEQFKHLIEKRGLAKELWHKKQRRSEKSVQRIFYAVADSYCKANNLDISPEVDTGTGEIDFKFSTGYNQRILVELKLSDNNKLVAGYAKQLEAYKEAEQTLFAVYVIVDVGGMSKKDEWITQLRNEQVGKGLRASEIVIIDGKIKPSASKL